MSPADGSGFTPDGSGETFVTSFDPADRPSEAIVTTVASVTGEEPVELSPLYDAVEPDALDALFEHAGRTDDPGSQTLTFAYVGYQISVSGDGTIEVTAV